VSSSALKIPLNALKKGDFEQGGFIVASDMPLTPNPSPTTGEKGELAFLLP